MFSSPCFRSALGCSKRLKLSSPIRPLTTTAPRFEGEVKSSDSKPVEEIKPAPSESLNQPEGVSPSSEPLPWAERIESIGSKFRLPLNVQALYSKPLKRPQPYGLPVCDLQLRSYDARHVEFFADFALRAAYYLNLPASGPVPLPRITERWTVNRSHFVHAKSKENFERITLRRLVQIKDGHPDVVQAWLAFLRKHAFHGVGMKANVFEQTSLGVGKAMDKTAKDMATSLDAELGHFGAKKGAELQESAEKRLERDRFVDNKMPLTSVRKMSLS